MKVINMNLISCNNCGVVLDKDKLDFPSDEEIEFDRQNGKDTSVWSGDRYIKTMPCLVCKEPVQEFEQ